MGRNPEGFRADWGEIKNKVMYDALMAKFTQHADLKEKLLETGEALIVEHTEEDSYWGDGGDGGDGTKGKNMLGQLLMQARLEINVAQELKK